MSSCRENAQIHIRKPGKHGGAGTLKQGSVGKHVPTAGGAPWRSEVGPSASLPPKGNVLLF